MIFYIGKNGTSFLVMKIYIYKIRSDTEGEDCISKKNWSRPFKKSLLSEETIIHPQTWQFSHYYYGVRQQPPFLTLKRKSVPQPYLNLKGKTGIFFS